MSAAAAGAPLAASIAATHLQLPMDRDRPCCRATLVRVRRGAAEPQQPWREMRIALTPAKRGAACALVIASLLCFTTAPPEAKISIFFHCFPIVRQLAGSTCCASISLEQG